VKFEEKRETNGKVVDVHLERAEQRVQREHHCVCLGRHLVVESPLGVDKQQGHIPPVRELLDDGSVQHPNTGRVPLLPMFPPESVTLLRLDGPTVL
jgi:hypothetical protein